ncbi:hypothetical protein Tco_0721736 [Tanacetum coccineum]
MKRRRSRHPLVPTAALDLLLNPTKRSSKAVTAGLFRVSGRNIAQLSIVATSKSYQEKGCFNAFSTALRVFFHIKKKIRQIEGEGEDEFSLRVLTHLIYNNATSTIIDLILIIIQTWFQPP